MKVVLNSIVLNKPFVSKAGKEYSVHEIGYLNKEGQPVTRRIFDNSELASVVETLSSGDLVDLKFTKQGQHFNLVGISKCDGTTSTASTTGKTGGTSKRSTGGTVDSQLGMQVGNAISNAATLIAAGCTETKDLQVEAARVLLVGNTLRSALASDTVSRLITTVESVECNEEEDPF